MGPTSVCNPQKHYNRVAERGDEKEEDADATSLDFDLTF